MMYNITDILSNQAKKTPDAIALLSINKSLSYKDLEELVSKLALYLDSKSIKNGDIVFQHFQDEFLLIISMLAISKIGATLVALPTQLSSLKIKELQNQLSVDFFITDQEYNGFDLDIQLIDVKYEKFSNISDTKKEFNTDPSLPWQIVVGSGTTGKEKLFEVSHNLELERVKISQKTLNISQNDVVASLIRINFNSTKIRFLASLYAGATYFIFEKEINDLVSICKKYEISILYSTVYHTEIILNFLNDHKKILDFLRVFSIGGSEISEDLKHRIKDKLTNKLYITYGTNEIGGISCTNFDTLFYTDQTVGKILNNICVEIVDDNDKDLPIEQIGHIRVKSPGMIKEYLNDKENSQKYIKNDWFYPGDLGKFTQNRELIYCGRSDHMMILNGINIYPSHIENRLLEHADVLDAACIPLKDKIHQDVPVSAVVLKSSSSISKDTLLNFCYESLAFASPREIIILDEIPRNSLGKLIRDKLKEKIISELFKSHPAL